MKYATNSISDWCDLICFIVTHHVSGQRQFLWLWHHHSGFQIKQDLTEVQTFSFNQYGLTKVLQRLFGIQAICIQGPLRGSKLIGQLANEQFHA